jgi:PIN domain nuclease of toxin-antitoxin system
VVLWATRAPEALSKTATVLLAETDNELLLSPVVVWEMAIKHQLGKLPEAQPLLADLATVRRDLRTAPLPINDEHALLAGTMNWAHKDPFDRMLAAQAMLAGAVILSVDTAFDDVPGLSRMW